MDATPNLELAATRAAQKFGVDPAVFKAMIRQESGFNPNAKSGAGARGIAQFIPSTAKAYGVNLNDRRVTDDLEGAARYLADNLRKTGGNYHQALSIYNSGRPDAYKDPSFANGQTYHYVRAILANAGHPTTAGTAPGASARQVSSTKTVGAVDNSASRQALVAKFLTGDHQDPLAFALGIRKRADVPGRQVTTTRQVAAGPSSAGGAVDASRAAKRASAIDRQRLPYQWGGGHGNTGPGQPLDCSGAVSKVLGINPRVASQFKAFGSPGRAPGGKGVTIYAKDTHVLMEINGRFFGTSSTNPGGGAGWIPRSAIPAQYLAGFTARHVT